MNELKHSAKGTTWGKHKYIAIKNGRYIYPDDTGSSGQPQVSKEYQEELEYNSRKNNYFGRKSPSPGGYSDDDTYELRNINSRGRSKINVNDFDRILDNREAAKKYNSERDYGRQETAFEKNWQDPNFQRVIKDRAYMKTRDRGRRLSGELAKGRLLTQEYKQRLHESEIRNSPKPKDGYINSPLESRQLSGYLQKTGRKETAKVKAAKQREENKQHPLKAVKRSVSSSAHDAKIKVQTAIKKVAPSVKVASSRAKASVSKVDPRFPQH
jgi:hypothetical protein